MVFASWTSTRSSPVANHINQRGLNMNPVVGATGLLGSEICRLLAAEEKPIRALVSPYPIP